MIRTCCRISTNTSAEKQILLWVWKSSREVWVSVPCLLHEEKKHLAHLWARLQHHLWADHRQLVARCTLHSERAVWTSSPLCSDATASWCALPHPASLPLVLLQACCRMSRRCSAERWTKEDNNNKNKNNNNNNNNNNINNNNNNNNPFPAPTKKMKHQEITRHPRKTPYSCYHTSVTTVYIQPYVHMCTYHKVTSCVYCGPCGCWSADNAVIASQACISYLLWCFLGDS